MKPKLSPSDGDDEQERKLKEISDALEKSTVDLKEMIAELRRSLGEEGSK